MSSIREKQSTTGFRKQIFHMPHLGEISQNLETQYVQNQYAQPSDSSGSEKQTEEKKAFEVYKNNQITTAELRESYRETLSIVELHVKDQLRNSVEKP